MNWAVSQNTINFRWGKRIRIKLGRASTYKRDDHTCVLRIYQAFFVWFGTSKNIECWHKEQMARNAAPVMFCSFRIRYRNPKLNSEFGGIQDLWKFPSISGLWQHLMVSLGSSRKASDIIQTFLNSYIWNEKMYFCWNHFLSFLIIAYVDPLAGWHVDYWNCNYIYIASEVRRVGLLPSLSKKMLKNSSVFCCWKIQNVLEKMRPLFYMVMTNYYSMSVFR